MFLLSCLPRTVFKKGNIEIDYFEKYHCLHISWSGKIDKEEYKTIMSQMLDFSRKLKVQFWIFDAREEDNFRFFDPEWSTNFLTKELAKHQIKKIARIASGNSYNETQMSSFMTQILTEHSLPFCFKYLPDTNHAIAWFLDKEHEL